MFGKLKKISLGSLFKKKQKKSLSFYPDKDWKIIFIFFVILNVAISVSAIFFYFKISKSEVDSGSLIVPQSSLSFDRENFDQVIFLYREKEANLEYFLEERPEITNPQ